jgi:peptidoglycan/LPS O-acetylase OafA/YrhL
VVGVDDFGAHWLAPTWTLAVEENFYLIAPALIIFMPRRWLVPILLGSIALTLSLRIAIPRHAKNWRHWFPRCFNMKTLWFDY